MSDNPPRNLDQPPITMMLQAARDGDSDAFARVWETVVAEFRDQASRVLARESKAQDFQTTMLVNEVFLKMHGDGEVGDFSNRSVFFGAVWRSMGQVLIDAAKARNAQKRGGGWSRVDFDFGDAAFTNVEGTIDHGEAIADALRVLEEKDPDAHQVAWFRLVGLERRQIAAALEIEPAEVDRHWRFGRAVLQDALENEGP